MKDSVEVNEFGFKTVICPICGNQTLDSHYICSHCKWEYDGTVNDNDYSSANGCTVGEYKIKFKHEV